MPRTRTPSKIHRFKKFKIKNDPTIRALVTYKILDSMTNIIKVWLAILDVVERITKDVCQKHNLPNEDLAYYIAYAKQQISLTREFDLETLKKEFQIIIDKWIKRNLQEQALNEIVEPVLMLGFSINHILDQVSQMQKYGWFNYSRFDTSHFW